MPWSWRPRRMGCRPARSMTWSRRCEPFGGSPRPRYRFDPDTDVGGRPRPAVSPTGPPEQVTFGLDEAIGSRAAPSHRSGSPLGHPDQGAGPAHLRPAYPLRDGRWDRPCARRRRRRVPGRPPEPCFLADVRQAPPVDRDRCAFIGSCIGAGTATVRTRRLHRRCPPFWPLVGASKRTQRTAFHGLEHSEER